MPFFLFLDTILVGATLMTWLTLEEFTLDPRKDGALALMLGLHGLLLLAAVQKREKIRIEWIGQRGRRRALGLTILLLIITHAYLFFPQLATLHYFSGSPTEIIPQPESLSYLENVILLGCWIIGGIGAAALCFGLLCLELERSGARQIAVYLGASGYAFLFLGQSVYYLSLGGQDDYSHVMRAVVIMMDRWFVAFAAGYLFITTRHLLGAAVLLGTHEWVVRYGLNEVQNSLFTPLVILQADNQKTYWIARLLSTALALAAAMYIYYRHQNRASDSGAAT
jgi:hypothetical protein